MSNLNRWVWAERSRDHILGNRWSPSVAVTMTTRLQLPHQRMVERQLLENASSKPINTRIPDMGDQGTARQNRQRTRGGSHVVELRITLSTLMNLSVGFGDRVAKGLVCFWILGTKIVHRNLFGRDATGKLARRVSTHPVGDDEEMAVAAESFRILRRETGSGVLVVGPAHTNVAEFSEDDSRIPIVLHRQLSRVRSNGNRRGNQNWHSTQRTRSLNVLSEESDKFDSCPHVWREDLPLPGLASPSLVGPFIETSSFRLKSR